MKIFRSLFLLIIPILISFGNFAQVRDYWPTKDWQTKVPDQVGMDVLTLQSMEQVMQSSMSFVDAFLIVKDGYLVYEKYFNGHTQNDYHIICSSTKSVTNVLMGILLKQNYIDAIDQQVIDFFPEYGNINSDPRINQLTIEHAMSYTTGLNTSDSESLNQTDMIKYYLSCDFSYDPGTQFRYATPASQIQSAIISKKTGKNARDFAEDQLFYKLGINNYNWPADAQGYTFGGYISYFCPRDMLKIGFLYLNKGVWDGQAIVDPEFVQISTSIHSDGGKPHNEKYGYNWWITENNGYNAYFAGGYGGQFIYVVPDLDLVVVITCDTNRHREDARFLINSHVVPSILSVTSTNKKSNIELPYLNVYPSMVDNELTVEFDIDVVTPLTVCIYNMSAKKMLTLIDDQLFSAGKHICSFNPELPCGEYILRGELGKRALKSKRFIIKPNQ